MGGSHSQDPGKVPRPDLVTAYPAHTRLRWPFDLLVSIALGGAAFILYISTLAPTVLAGDGGEFQFVPYLLGVAHPTGYPLYCLLGWVWSSLLPVGDVAYRMNLFSAFWAAMAVGLLYPTTRSFLKQAIPTFSPLIRRLLAALAAVTFAVTPTFWSQAIIAEVYPLHIFLIVLVFFLLLRWGDHRLAGSSPHAKGHLLFPAAFCFGLGLAHHSTTLFLAPAILAYVWLTDRRIYLEWRRVSIPGLLLALLPLVLYLYIPLRAPHTPYLRWPLDGSRELVLYENTLPGFLDFVLGGPFRGSVDWSVDLAARLSMVWGFLRDEVTWVGLVLSFVGLLRLTFQRRWALLTFTALTCLSTVAFNLVYTIGDIFVLFIPAYLVIVLWLVVGAATLVQILAKSGARLPRSNHRQDLSGSLPLRSVAVLASVAMALLFFALPISMGVTHYGDVDQSGNTLARARWEAILAEPLPPEAILISNDRNNIMPMWYFQFVEDGRPSRLDLLGLFPLITPDYPTLGHVLDLALSTGRPIYLVKEMPGIEVKVITEADGRLWRVTGPAVEGEPAYSRALRLADAVVLTGYDRSPRSPKPGEVLQVSLYLEALRPLPTEYHSFVHLLDPAGQKVAQSDRQPGGVFYPTTLWRIGERLRDDHVLTVPADAPPGVYRLLAGMYAISQDGALQPLGDPVIVGQVAVKTEQQTELSTMGHPVQATFAGLIELLGYDIELQGGMLDVTLYWRCVQPPNADYTVFVHLLGPDGQTLDQHDSQPQDSAYPTSVWDAGEVIADAHLLALPSGGPEDVYRLTVGLYLLETGQRLSLDGGGDSLEFELVGLGE